MWMEAEMRSAWMIAGLKMGLGFFVVAAVLGIRVVSVAPERDAAEFEDDVPVAASQPIEPAGLVADAPPNNEDSSIGRVMTGMRERLPGSGAAERRPGDRMVSCRMRGATQFMTADDCATRGGRSTLFESDR
jgi:hypothetical protein